MVILVGFTPEVPAAEQTKDQQKCTTSLNKDLAKTRSDHWKERRGMRHEFRGRKAR
jgi:hypothetical protein